MSKSEQKHRVPTAHGEVEYETVECDSCGEQVAREAATSIVVGDVKEKAPLNGLDYSRYKFHGTPAEGWVCEYCQDDPAGFPRVTYTLSTEEIIMIAGVVVVVALTLLDGTMQLAALGIAAVEILVTPQILKRAG